MIASTVNLHPNYAMQLFRTYTGRTIVSYLNQYRIAHAQQLLLTTDKSVIDIAYESGFNSLSRFYAVFRKTCRLSPARYRQTVGRGLIVGSNRVCRPAVLSSTRISSISDPPNGDQPP